MTIQNTKSRRKSSVRPTDAHPLQRRRMLADIVHLSERPAVGGEPGRETRVAGIDPEQAAGGELVQETPKDGGIPDPDGGPQAVLVGLHNIYHAPEDPTVPGGGV